MQNASSDEANVIPGRIAQRTLAARNARYTDEVRRLLDAALQLMRECGTTSKPRVVDIVAAAGLSNDTFYRHFASKDTLVATLLEDGSERLRGYLEHQMAKDDQPEVQVARWVEGVLSQADDDIAATTLAVLWNGGSVGQGPASGRHFASGPLSTLLLEPFAALGSTTPELDAALVAHATFGKLSDYLWQRESPTRPEIDRIIAFCLAAVTRA